MNVKMTIDPPMPSSNSRPVATIRKFGDSNGLLVHEWIEPAGGAEKVLDAFVDLFPESDLFCLWNDAPDRYRDTIIKESWLAKTQLRQKKALIVPLLSNLWRNVDLPDYDWALVSSHLFSHHIAANKSLMGKPTFIYAHTPARYIWEPQLDARGSGRMARIFSPYFRKTDRKHAQESFMIAANSNFVKARIESSWNRSSEVIYPPVDVQRISQRNNWEPLLSSNDEEMLSKLPAEFILGASRVVPYKRLDAVIEMGRVTKTPVVIAGDGPDLPRLRSLASASPSPVIFLGQVSDSMLFELYTRTIAYVFPPVEDFGIMPVEAMAAGSPVIAGPLGGASETVIEGITGSLVDFNSEQDMKKSLDSVTQVSRDMCVSRAWEFDTSIFTARIQNWMASAGVGNASSIPSYENTK